MITNPVRLCLGMLVVLGLVLRFSESPTLASTVVAWGESSRPLGSPPSMTTNVPAGLIDAVAVAGGTDVGFALRANGSVASWGNPLVTALRNVPPDLTDAAALCSGTRHVLALRRNGTSIGWGEDRYGKTEPPPLLHRVMAVAAGDSHSLALQRDGTVTAWGEYSWAQQTSVPAGLSDAVAVAAAGYFSLALRRDGSVIAWGGTFSPSNISDTVKVPQGLSNVVAIVASFFEAFALRDDGTVVNWGSGVTAGPIPGITNLVAIAVAGEASSDLLGLMENGTLVRWPTGSQFSMPAGLSNVVAIGGIGVPSVALIRGPDEPFLTRNPESRTVTSGTSVSFRVEATAGQPLRYQWQFNGVELRGATNATLNIKQAWPAQAGHYRAVVTAAGLSIISRAALLKVAPPL